MSAEQPLVTETPTRSPKSRPNRPRASVDALELQRLLMEDARNCEEPNIRAQVCKAWQGLQELRLRMAMKPAPKAVDVGYKPKRSHQRKPTQSDPSALPASEPLPGT